MSRERENSSGGSGRWYDTAKVLIPALLVVFALLLFRDDIRKMIKPPTSGTTEVSIGPLTVRQTT